MHTHLVLCFWFALTSTQNVLYCVQQAVVYATSPIIWQAGGVTLFENFSYSATFGDSSSAAHSGKPPTCDKLSSASSVNHLKLTGTGFNIDIAIYLARADGNRIYVAVVCL